MKDLPDCPQAFPFVADEDKGEHLHVEWGMSLRDWFAGQALPAKIRDADAFNALQRATSSDIRVSRDNVAHSCYAYADAMLRAREPQGAPGTQDVESTIPPAKDALRGAGEAERALK